MLGKNYERIYFKTYAFKVSSILQIILAYFSQKMYYNKICL